MFWNSKEENILTGSYGSVSPLVIKEDEDIKASIDVDIWKLRSH
jgi:hypothetical protein